MRIRLLGTGTPTPSLRRMCSGYVVEIGDDVIVFDHGFGAHHRLLELGIPPTKVTHFFCSHLHYDHMGDYPRLLLTRWDQGAGKIPELKVYGPPPGVVENGYLSVVTAPGRRGGEVVAKLKAAGIGAARTYPETMDVQPPVEKTGAIVHGDLRVSKRFCEAVVNLPLFYGIRDDEREACASALLSLL